LETEVETVFYPGRTVLDSIESLFVGKVPIPLSQWTFLKHVLDPTENAVGGSFPFSQADKWLHLFWKPSSRLQHRPLATQVLMFPAKDVSEENSRFVIKVMPSSKSVVVAAEGGIIKEVAFRKATDTAGCTSSSARTSRYVEVEL
jgi:hypothetical protein|tara:strand:+ start:5119 stop:5553 length:435 start_codon:yes stop_codon:yes gene_type:complete